MLTNFLPLVSTLPSASTHRETIAVIANHMLTRMTLSNTEYDSLVGKEQRSVRWNFKQWTAPAIKTPLMGWFQRVMSVRSLRRVRLSIEDMDT